VTDEPQQAGQHIVLVASRLLAARPEDLWLDDITPSFPWAQRYRFIRAMSRDRRCAVIGVGESEPALPLTDGSGLARLSAILLVEKGEIPGDLTGPVLAEAVRRLTVDPRGLLASPELLRRKSPPLRAWSRTGRSADEALLRAHCVEPRLTKDAAGWRLEFNYANHAGGIERWTVTGTRTVIASGNVTMSVADGTFNWPFE